MTRRILELDGLRGIAILLVMSFHYLNNQLINAEGMIGKIIAKITSFGWVGVDLFFVLSGFLIGSILISTKNSPNYFRTFYIRRFLRIVPNYYLLLIVFILIGLIPYFQTNHFITGGSVIPMWSYFAMLHNLYMAKFMSLGNDAISVTWSIGIEEQFYLIFPFLLYFVKKEFLPMLLCLIIIASPILRFQFNHWIPPYVLLYCRMDALAFGILVAYFYERNMINSIVRRYGIWLAVTVTATVIVSAYLYYMFHDLGVFRNTIFSVVFAIIVLLALSDRFPLFRSMLRNNQLRWIGTISYSLYLFHYLVLGLFHHLTGRRDGIGMYNAKDVIVSMAALCTSLLFAWFVYRKLENPMVRWGKKFIY